MELSFLLAMDVVGTIAFAISGAMLAIKKEMEMDGDKLYTFPLTSIKVKISVFFLFTVVTTLDTIILVSDKLC